MPRKADARLEGRILDAAYHLWSKGGEDAVTMRAVAKAAKTTTPTLYERFRDKDDLITFLRDRARQKMFEFIRPSQTAIDVCRRALDFAALHGNEYRLITADWAARLGRKEPLPSFNYLKERLARQLGGPPAQHAELALALVALVHGTAILALGKGADPKSTRDLKRACLAACEALMRKSKSAASS